jgi:hypothetical protein
MFACSGSSDSTGDEPQPQTTDQQSEELHKKHCVLNGLFLPCRTGEHDSTTTCKCVK